MGMMGLMGVMVAVLPPDAGHAFAQAALLDEVLLQAAKLLIQEVVGLVDQAEGDVGDDLGGAGFHKLPIVFIGNMRLFAELPHI